MVIKYKNKFVSKFMLVFQSEYFVWIYSHPKLAWKS